ncbi:MAG: hypothetical protein Q7S83_02505 [bacterium]|nr:hypothetical protein [bacterium]
MSKYPLVLLALGYALLAIPGAAQIVPEFIVTWRADSYVPPQYLGKALPGNETNIDLALEILDGGRLANLSDKEIRWLINGDALKSGTGLKNISFIAEGVMGDQEVEVTVIGYKGGEPIAKSLIIPMTDPEAAIYSGENTFRALLYFFNIKNLQQALINWSANGLAPEQSNPAQPDILNLDTSGFPVGEDIEIQLQATNSKDPLETAGASITVTKK